MKSDCCYLTVTIRKSNLNMINPFFGARNSSWIEKRNFHVYSFLHIYHWISTHYLKIQIVCSIIRRNGNCSCLILTATYFFDYRWLMIIRADNSICTSSFLNISFFLSYFRPSLLVFLLSYFSSLLFFCKWLRNDRKRKDIQISSPNAECV